MPKTIEYPRSFAHKLYASSKLHQHLLRGAVHAQAQCVERSGKLLERPAKSHHGRLLQAVALGALSGPATRLAPREGNLGRTSTASLSFDLYVSAVVGASLATWTLRPAKLAAALSVAAGCGIAIKCPDDAGVARRTASALMQHGVLGLPELALLAASDHLAARKQGALAAACLIAATLYGLPLELCRSLFTLVALAPSAATFGLSSLVAVLSNVAQWAVHNDEPPAQYVTCSTEAKMAHTVRQICSPAPNSPAPITDDPPHLLASHAQRMRFAYTTVLAPVGALLLSQSADEAQRALQAHKLDAAALTHRIDDVHAPLSVTLSAWLDALKHKHKLYEADEAAPGYSPMDWLEKMRQQQKEDALRAFSDLLFSEHNNPSAMLYPLDVARHADELLLRVHPLRIADGRDASELAALVASCRSLITTTQRLHRLLVASKDEIAAMLHQVHHAQAPGTDYA